ncbi:MAG: DctP family TRAP transporter solute-binding subunit [Synergistetes bacterium]|nr:DctP family TRAP transporter solute-binding subunit [Synergistota bacterium]
MRKVLVGCLVIGLLGAMVLPAFGATQYRLKVAYVVPVGYPHDVAMRQVFKPYVEKASGGRIKVELYPAGQLGGDSETIESLQLGSLEMCLPATAILASFEPALQILDLPYLFMTKNQAYQMLDGPKGKKLVSYLPKHGLRSLAFAEIGFRHITNNRRPIHSPKDLRGLKIRVMRAPTYMDMFRTWGASPTPLAFSELYSALQQGVVDGEDNPVFVIKALKFYEVQKYLSLTAHTYASISVLVSEKFFKSLPKDLQKVLEDGAVKFRNAQRDICNRREKKDLEILKEKGMIVNKLTSAEKKVFAKAARGVYDRLRNKLGRELFDSIFE